MMHDREEYDSAIVAKNPANRVGLPAAEQGTSTTSSQGSLERVIRSRCSPISSTPSQAKYDASSTASSTRGRSRELTG